MEQQRQVQRPMDDSQADYDSTPESVEMARRFANRPLSEIMSGDPGVAKGLSGPQALEALENGTYRGLEGIDFGTSYGRPVAKLPNGTVVEVTAGQMISAVKTREAKRRELLAGILRNADRDAYVSRNQQAFDTLLQGLIDDGGLSPAAASVYQQSFESDPKSTLGTLIGIDRNDRRAMKEAERVAQKQADENMRGAVERRLDNLKSLTESRMAAGATPAELAAESAKNQGLVALGQAVMDGGVNWEATTPVKEVGTFFGSQVLAGNKRLSDLFSALDTAKFRAEDEGRDFDVRTAPGFNEIVEAIRDSAGQVVPGGMSEGYAAEVAASLFGDTMGSAIHAASNAASAVEQRAGDTMFGDLVYPPDAPYSPSRAKDVDDNDLISTRELRPVAMGFLRKALSNIGEQVSGLSDDEMESYFFNRLNVPGANHKALVQIHDILVTQFKMGMGMKIQGEGRNVGRRSTVSQERQDAIDQHGIAGVHIPGPGESVRRGSSSQPGPREIDPSAPDS